MRLFKNINFLSNFPFLSHLQFETIKSIYLYCEIKTFNFNKILYKEGDDPAFFYMIKTGSFMVKFLKKQYFKINFLFIALYHENNKNPKF